MASQHYTNRLPEDPQGFVEESRQQIAERPASFAALAFGLGFGLGVALAVSMSPRTQTQRGTAQRLGEQLMDSMSNVIPKSWTS